MIPPWCRCWIQSTRWSISSARSIDIKLDLPRNAHQRILQSLHTAKAILGLKSPAMIGWGCRWRCCNKGLLFYGFNSMWNILLWKDLWGVRSAFLTLLHQKATFFLSWCLVRCISRLRGLKILFEWTSYFLVEQELDPFAGLERI